MSVDVSTTNLEDTVLCHYLFDENFDLEKAAQSNPKINHVAQQCLERIETVFLFPLIVTEEAEFGQVLGIMRQLSLMQLIPNLEVAKQESTSNGVFRMCGNQYSRAVIDFIPSLLRGKNPFTVF